MRYILWITLVIIGFPLFKFASVHEVPAFAADRLASDLASDPECWIIANQPVGNLSKPQSVLVSATAYPNRALAEAAKGAHGAVVEFFGKQWLLSIEDDGWHAPAGGERIAEIGPLPVTAGEAYTAQFMEAVFNTGMTAPAHLHSGPELGTR